MNKLAVVRTEKNGAASRRPIDIRVAVILLVAAVLSALAPGEALAVSFKAGMTAPDFTVPALRGDTVSLHDYRGKVVLVMFWSSWCSRCREELEFLRTMKDKYPALEILALNSETDKPTAEDLSRIEETVQVWNLPLTVAIDDGLRVWNLYQVNALPTTMIVGADGTILFIEPNFYWASPETFDSALRSAYETMANGVLPETSQFMPFDFADLEKDTCRKALCLIVAPPRP